MLVRRASNAFGSAADATIAEVRRRPAPTPVATGVMSVAVAGGEPEPIRRARARGGRQQHRDRRPPRETSGRIPTPSDGNEPTPTGERRQFGAEGRELFLRVRPGGSDTSTAETPGRTSAGRCAASVTSACSAGGGGDLRRRVGRSGPVEKSPTMMAFALETGDGAPEGAARPARAAVRTGPPGAGPDRPGRGDRPSRAAPDVAERPVGGLGRQAPRARRAVPQVPHPRARLVPGEVPLTGECPDQVRASRC